MKKHNKYIIALTSGLGNQMNQYALYIYLKNKGCNVKLFCFNKYLNEHNGLELSRVFSPISIEKQSIFISWYVTFYRFIKFISFYLHLNINSLFKWDVVVVPQWKNYLFVEEIKTKLCNEVFVFSEFQDKKNKELFERISSENSVSIHIRRNDYIKNPYWRKSHGDICNLDYYDKAIDHMKGKVNNLFFVIFSDDIDWAKNNLKIDNAVFVDWNFRNESFRDIQLMSLCKHNIIANSTFSWWGACLNQNQDKIVVAPSKWLNVREQRNAKKFLFKNWVIIDNNKPNVTLIVDCAVCDKEIKNILRQTYEDFELLIPFNDNNCNIKDERIKNLAISNASGNHKFKVQSDELILFKNKRYLSHKLTNYFKKLA